MVHGRFQPFHNGHLEYVLEAAGRCRMLLIGITNPDASVVPEERSSPHRHLASANPFTFQERSLMVTAALASARVAPERYGIISFPIHDPSRWVEVAPRDTTQFIRVFSAWEEEKAARLRAAGYRVVELPVADKAVSGTEVRRRLAEHGDWRSLVPASVAELLVAAQINPIAQTPRR